MFLSKAEPRFLFSPDPAPGGGTGEPPPAADDSTDVMTAEELGNMVTGAVKNHLKKMLPESLTAALAGLKLDERFASLETKLAAPPAPQQTPASEPHRTELEKKLAAIEAQLAEEKTARALAENARIQADEARAFDGARLALRNALKDKAGEDYLDDWVDRLSVIDKRLSVSEDGKPMLKVRHSAHKSIPEEDVDMTLEQAIPVLLSKPEYKKYQPAPGGTNDGRRSPGPRNSRSQAELATSTNPLDRAEAKLASLGVSFNEEFG